MKQGAGAGGETENCLESVTYYLRNPISISLLLYLKNFGFGVRLSTISPTGAKFKNCHCNDRDFECHNFSHFKTFIRKRPRNVPVLTGTVSHTKEWLSMLSSPAFYIVYGKTNVRIKTFQPRFRLNLILQHTNLRFQVQNVFILKTTPDFQIDRVVKCIALCLG